MLQKEVFFLLLFKGKSPLKIWKKEIPVLLNSNVLEVPVDHH